MRTGLKLHKPPILEVPSVLNLRKAKLFIRTIRGSKFKPPGGGAGFSRLEVSSVWTSTIRTGSQRSGSSPDHSPKSHLPPGNTKLPHLGRAAAGSTRPDCHQRSPGIRCLRNSSAFPDQKPNHLLRPSGSLLRLHPPLGPRVRSQGPRLPEGPRSADA